MNLQGSADTAADALEGYHKFLTDQGESYGSFEVFWLDVGSETRDDNGQSLESGWYWWPCFPGCLPDAEQPTGPFDVSADAYLDALSTE